MKKYISLILICCLLLQLYGCYSMQSISIEELQNPNDKKDIIAFTKDSVSYSFKRYNYSIKNDSIEGKGWMNNWEMNKKDESFNGKVAISDLEFVHGESFNSLNTCLFGLGIGGVAFIVAKIIVGSSKLMGDIF